MLETAPLVAVPAIDPFIETPGPVAEPPPPPPPPAIATDADAIRSKAPIPAKILMLSVSDVIFMLAKLTGPRLQRGDE